jgi:hypothetical protein
MITLPPGCRATRYTFGGNPRHSIAVELTHHDHDTWAIRRDGDVLNRDGKWEWEPTPSERDDDFLARTRFDFTDALKLAAIEYANGTP